MTRRLRMSIENRILIPFVSIILVVIIGISMIFFVTEYQVMLQSAKTEGEALISYLNADINAGEFWKDPEALLKKYEEAYPGDALFIYDAAGNCLFGRRDRADDTGGELVLSESADNRLNWRILVSLDRKAMVLTFIEEQRYMILAAIAMLILIIQAGMLIAYNISAPIAGFSEICTEISRAPSESRPDAVKEYSRRSDEIGQLADAFTIMMQSMKEYTDQLNWVKALNESIVGNLPTGVVVCDREGNLIFRNSRAEGMFSEKEEKDAEGRDLDAVFADIVLKKELLPPPAEMKDPSGKVRHLEFGSWKLRHPDTGEDWGTLYTIDDVTYQRHMEEKITNDEKLAYTGKLAAAVAHEAKNPLAGIRAGLQVIERKMLSDRDRLLCAEMIREVDRVNGLISNLVDIARRRESEKTWVSLNSLCDELLLLYYKVAENNGINLVVFMQPDLRIMADEQEIRQILINLINNCFKALDQGGYVMLTGNRSAEGVILVVQDNGSGMEAEKLDAVLRGERGGIGLSIVRRLTEQNGGTFRMESFPGEGTRAIMTFGGSKGEKDEIQTSDRG